MENLYFIFYFFIYIFLSSIPTTKKCQIAYFEKKILGINFQTLQIYKGFAGINFRRPPISQHFAEETFTNRAKNRENTKVSSIESFFLNLSLSSGFLTSLIKRVKVVPVDKKDSKLDCHNHCLISHLMEKKYLKN